MSRSRIVFFVIIAIALLIIALPRALELLPTAPTATPLPELQVEIAVNPMAYPWVAAQAATFNARQPQADGRPARITVTQVDGVSVWQTGSTWSVSRHPAGWLPEATFTLDYAADAGLRYEAITPSVASTSLVWGIFTDRADVLGTPLDWRMFQTAAVKENWKALGGEESWGFVKPAFNLPQNNSTGYGALLTAAATFASTEQVSDQAVRDRAYQDWLKPVIDAMPSTTTMGSQISTTLASRGASVADFALLPESEWVTNYTTINARQKISFAYPGYNITFNMPLAVWSGAETTSAERTLLRQFSDFLMQKDAQRQAASYGLRPAAIPLSEADLSKFNAATAAGIKLDAVPSTAIVVPSRSSALALIGWFRAIRPS